MRKNRLLSVIAFVIVVAGIRFAFDPTVGKRELPYDRFCKLVQENKRTSKIEKIYLQLGLCDFWGRDVSLVNLRNADQPVFVVTPSGFYQKAASQLRSQEIECHNVCLDMTAMLEITLALTWLFVLVAANYQLFRRQSASG